MTVPLRVADVCVMLLAEPVVAVGGPSGVATEPPGKKARTATTAAVMAASEYRKNCLKID